MCFIWCFGGFVLLLQIEIVYGEMSRGMSRLLLISVILVTAVVSMARDLWGTNKVSYPGGKCKFYRVYLADKQDTVYSLSRPVEFLSRRALARRAQQHLPLDSTDLPIAPRYLAALEEEGFEVVCKSKWNNTVVVRVRKPKSLRRLDTLSFVARTRLVLSAPDSIEQRSRTSFRTDVLGIERHDNEYGVAQGQIESLGGTYLHQMGYWGKGKIIAVFDGGFMNVDKIPALHQLRLMGIADFVVPRSGNIFQESDHGTMVLSTMAVNEPYYYIGVSPEASYVLVRTEDEHTESLIEEDYWAAGAEYADSLGVDVINSSLGYHDFDDKAMNYAYCQQDGHTALISHTASLLAGKGIVLVNSAGNEGMGSWKRVNFPADAHDILTIGSINSHGVNAPFSSVGPTADGRVKPDVMAWGSSVSVFSGRGLVINDVGTSFSSPLIAGLVACLWQALPDKTALEIIGLVRRSANRYAVPDNIYGYGVPDFWKAYQMGKNKK